MWYHADKCNIYIAKSICAYNTEVEEKKQHLKGLKLHLYSTRRFDSACGGMRIQNAIQNASKTT